MKIKLVEMTAELVPYNGYYEGYWLRNFITEKKEEMVSYWNY